MRFSPSGCKGLSPFEVKCKLASHFFCYAEHSAKRCWPATLRRPIGVKPGIYLPVLVMSFIYDLPSRRRARRWFGNARPASWRISNWHFSNIPAFRTGVPFTLGITQCLGRVWDLPAQRGAWTSPQEHPLGGRAEAFDFATPPQWGPEERCGRRKLLSD